MGKRMNNRTLLRKLQHCKERIARQAAEIEHTRTLLLGVDDLNRAKVALDIATALQYGEKTADGYEMRLPAVSVGETLARWEASTVLDGDELVTTVKERTAG